MAREPVSMKSFLKGSTYVAFGCWSLAVVAGTFAAGESPDKKKTLPPAVSRTIDFDKDVRPILQERCYSCHGEDKQEGDLRLDREEDAPKGASRARSSFPAKAIKVG